MAEQNSNKSRGTKKSRGPLYGLRVLDITDIRGAMCARFLADLGADVIRFPFEEESEEAKETFAHKFRNANKRAIQEEFSKDLLFEKIAHADVLVENLGAKLLEENGLLNISEQFEKLIHISLSDFGLAGPHANWRLEPLPAFSASGAHAVSGFSDLSPCWLPGYMAHDCASVFGAVGAVAAVMDRRRTSSGQMVEVSVQEAALNGMNPWSIMYERYLEKNPYLPAHGGRFADSTYWVLPAKDGWVRTVLGTATHWKGFLNVIGNPEPLLTEEWEVLGFRAQNSDIARLLAAPSLETRTRDELFVESQQNKTMIGPVHTLKEFMEHPQTKSREFFAETDFAGLEGIPIATPPWKMEKTPASLRLAADSPVESLAEGEEWLDADNLDFCPNEGYEIDTFSLAGKPNSNNTTSNNTTPDLLLSGIRVIEFGAAAVVPEMCWLLTELGAEVIKLESRTHPDVLRISESGDLDARFAFNAECRGRKSVALDLASDKGREIAFELCASADIVAENFRGGSLNKMGLSYEALSTANPSLIYVSSQGYGRGGPMGETAAFGPINSAFAGIHKLWNHSDEDLEGRYPCGPSLNHPDHIAGKLLAISVLAAIDHRARTGEGQLIDMSQAEAGAYFLGHLYMQDYVSGDCVANGNRSKEIVVHDTYQCVGEDNWVSIVTKTDDEFLKLADVIGGENKDWATFKARLECRAKIDSWVSQWTKDKEPMDVVAMLQENGVSAMMVQGPKDHHTDPHLKARKYIVELEHPVVGMEQHTGNPMLMEKTELETAGPSPCLGADTHDVLMGLLGYSESEVDHLIDTKICW